MDNKLVAIAVGSMIGVAINFVPTLVAQLRRHPERQLITRLNPLSLLSFLLWVALLAWAAGGARNDSVIGRFVGTPGNRGRLITAVAVLVCLGLATTAVTLR